MLRAMSSEDVDRASYSAKLRRGFAHRDDLVKVLQTRLTDDPRRVSRRDNAHEQIARIVWAEWTLASEPPDYTEAALILGDFIHNLRAAMDHAIWSVTPGDVQAAKPTEVSFPLYARKSQYEGWARKRETWYGAAVLDIIEYCQPFNAVGTGKTHPLHILQFLSNNDKHRLLNIVAHNQVDMGSVVVDPEPPDGVRCWVNRGVVAKGSVVARVAFERPAERASVDLMPVFAYEQVCRYVDQDGMERWLPVGEAMNEIGPDVVEAVFHVVSAHERDRGDEA
jgi:hypothetical protein